MDKKTKNNPKTADTQALKPQTYKQRFFYALFPYGLLCFIYLFFGPLSLIHNNTAAFHLTISQATPWYLAAFVAATAALAAALALLRGRVFDGAVNFTLWAGIASYIQRNMLNIDFGLLDGKTIPWHEYTSQALINLGVWLALLLAVSIAAALLGKRWKKVVCFASAILILMQTTALVTFYIDAAAQEKSSERYYLTTDSLTDISARENVTVFILDALSNDAVRQLLEAYPDALESFDDFIYYRNCAPTFYGTYPELIATLTGYNKYDTTRSYDDFERDAWTSDTAESFYKLLNDADYKASVFAQRTVVTQTLSNIRGKINNVNGEEGLWGIHPKAMYKSIGALTMWEYLPLSAKAAFFTTPDDFADMAFINSEEGSASWNWSGRQLVNSMSENGLRVVDNNVFSLYHLSGAHAPYHVDEAGQYQEFETSLTIQVRGDLAIIENYMNELKEIGAYDSTTIIIMGDHGDFSFLRDTSNSGINSAALFVKRRGDRHEEMPTNDAPVTHQELLPTIAAEIDPDYAFDFGRTLSDIGEDEVRERTLYRWIRVNPETKAKYDSFFVFNYDYNINDLNDLSEPDEVLPLYDSYY